MKNFRDEINFKIVSLRMEMDDMREARLFHRVAEIRLEISRLQAILRNCKEMAS